jgi:hypothetical protein
MTAAQLDRINLLLERFGCEPDDLVVDEKPFDHAEGWIVCTIGQKKGRPFTFGVSPEGDSHS